MIYALNYNWIPIFEEWLLWGWIWVFMGIWSSLRMLEASRTNPCPYSHQDRLLLTTFGRAKGRGRRTRTWLWVAWEFTCVRNLSTWREYGAWFGFQFIAHRRTWNPEDDFYGFLKNKIYGLSYCATHALRVFCRARLERRPVQSRGKDGSLRSITFYNASIKVDWKCLLDARLDAICSERRTILESKPGVAA